MKTLLRFLLRLLFGFRAYNEEVLKTPGPVLLLPNHVSWLDWLFLFACTDKDWKCIVSERTAHTSWLHRKIMINRRYDRQLAVLNAGGDAAQNSA